MNEVSSDRLFGRSINKNLIIFSALCIGAGLRVLYLFDDVWLDEIWSLNLARSVDSLVEIYTNIKFDANHILNTAYLHLVQDTNSWLFYRALSLICGLISIFLIYRIASLFGSWPAIISAVLAASSFLLVLYSSEARGYSVSIMCSLLSFIFLQQYLTKGKTVFVGLFWISAILAMLGHFSYAYVYAGLLQWSLFALWVTKENRLDVLKGFLLLHVVPAIVFLFLYFDFILNMGVAGANISSWSHEITKFSSLVYGFPGYSVLGVGLFVISIGVVLTVSFQLYKNNSIYWPLFLLVVIVNPIFVLLFASYGFPQMRYFLLLLPFFLIAFSYLLGTDNSYKKITKPISAIVLGTIVAANLSHVFKFAENGRGEYSKAIQYLAYQNREEEGAAVISSDHDYRNYALIEFYSKYLETNLKIHYITREAFKDHPSKWYFVHDFSVIPNPKPQIQVREEFRYELVASFKASNPDIIGWHWHLYRRL